MLGTHKLPIGRTKRKFVDEVRTRKEMRKWFEKCEKEKGFRAKIKKEYRQNRKTILAAKLKALENKGDENGSTSSN